MVSAILDRIAAALAAGDRVELRDFGAFSVRTSEARASRNPRTGDKVTVPARVHVQFKPGKGMKTRLNRRPLDPSPENEVERLLRAS